MPGDAEWQGRVAEQDLSALPLEGPDVVDLVPGGGQVGADVGDAGIRIAYSAVVVGPVSLVASGVQLDLVGS